MDLAACKILQEDLSPKINRICQLGIMLFIPQVGQLNHKFHSVHMFLSISSACELHVCCWHYASIMILAALGNQQTFRQALLHALTSKHK